MSTVADDARAVPEVPPLRRNRDFLLLWSGPAVAISARPRHWWRIRCWCWPDPLAVRRRAGRFRGAAPGAAPPTPGRGAGGPVEPQAGDDLVRRPAGVAVPHRRAALPAANYGLAHVLVVGFVGGDAYRSGTAGVHGRGPEPGAPESVPVALSRNEAAGAGRDDPVPRSAARSSGSAGSGRSCWTRSPTWCRWSPCCSSVRTSRPPAPVRPRARRPLRATAWRRTAAAPGSCGRPAGWWRGWSGSGSGRCCAPRPCWWPGAICSSARSSW